MDPVPRQAGVSSYTAAGLPGHHAGFGEQAYAGYAGAAAGAYGAGGAAPRKAIPDWLRDEMKKRNLDGSSGAEP